MQAKNPSQQKQRKAHPTASAMAKIANFMQRLNLECTPANFELIFAVLSGDNEALREDFSKLGRNITQNDLDGLIRKHVSHHVEDDIASESIDTVGEELNEFMDLVKSESAALANYDKVIKEQTQGLNDPANISPEKLQSTLTTITQATERKIAEGNKVRQAVSQQVKRLDAVATDLNTYKQQKFMDPLTGLPNRRAFNKESLSIYQGDKVKDCSLAFVEIDNFAAVKDNFGNLIADKFVVHTSQILSKACSGKDYIARAGDGKFAFIFWGISDATAKSIASKLNSEIASSPLLNASNGEPIGSVSVSTGICASINASSTGDIIAKTEAALNSIKMRKDTQIKVFEGHRTGDTSLERNEWSLYEPTG